MSPSPRSVASVRHASRHGFSLLELLTSIAIIAVLLAVLLPSIRGVRASTGTAIELSTARQLMTAYTTYAYDHDARVLPGYWGEDPELPAYNAQGEMLTGEAAHRYPWRLAPYVDFSMTAIVQDEKLLRALEDADPNLADYWVSLYPTMGINGFFVGRDTSVDGPFRQIFGDFAAMRISRAKQPAKLIVFGSARITDTPYAEGAPGDIEGYFRLLPPFRNERDWTEDGYDPDADAVDFGYVSLRHQRSAAIGFMDGHADLLGEGELQDMRHWTGDATRADWTLNALID